MRLDEVVTETINITGIRENEEREVRLFLGGGSGVDGGQQASQGPAWSRLAWSPEATRHPRAPNMDSPDPVERSS